MKSKIENQKSKILLPFLAAFALACATLVPSSAATIDAATQKRLDGKTTKIIGALKLDDTAKVERVKVLLGDWFVTLWAWHEQHDPQLKELWTKWNAARAVVPKDEFPAEVIAYQIDDVYASLRPARDAFIAKLAAELTPEQLDAFKENWSRSPGLKRTYNAFLEIAPDLTEEQKKVIFDHLNRAREAALLTDADKEIVNIFKRHKVKAEAYVGTLEWAKLHRAFANKGK
ncbi:DUF3826 domain-containing protein [Oleiharenicola lentus]|uniref:DUF3826 domain-containing protein n=1 Tax=Oleiharenicola lentus TaxID=2508720 RepID=A0A4Q1C5Q5_9BACT|nr:DUF3826 domain-containing protein [Oleiharenicola lentus]RXK53629.1 DUF3826 domain-containing protein [Oleiharenicola lentus]